MNGHDALGPSRRLARYGPDDLDEHRFVAEHVQAGRPAVVHGAAAGWPLTGLTGPAMAERFGDRRVPIYDDLFRLRRIRELSTFLATPADAGNVRWYSTFRADARFPWSDDVFTSIRGEWSAPPFFPADDLVLPAMGRRRSLSPVDDLFPGRGLFVCHVGARTRRHVDPWSSDALLCQVSGTKILRLWWPGPDDPLDVRLSTGDVAYLPAGVPHATTAVSFSISLTWNFVLEVSRARFERWLVDAPSDERRVASDFLDEPLPPSAPARGGHEQAREAAQ